MSDNTFWYYVRQHLLILCQTTPSDIMSHTPSDIMSDNTFWYYVRHWLRQ